MVVCHLGLNLGRFSVWFVFVFGLGLVLDVTYNTKVDCIWLLFCVAKKGMIGGFDQYDLWKHCRNEQQICHWTILDMLKDTMFLETWNNMNCFFLINSVFYVRSNRSQEEDGSTLARWAIWQSEASEGFESEELWELKRWMKFCSWLPHPKTGLGRKKRTAFEISKTC